MLRDVGMSIIEGSLLGVAIVFVVASLTSTAVAQPDPGCSPSDAKRGHWWYADCSQDESPEGFELREPERPYIPWNDLDRMHPKQVGELIDAQLSFALVDETTEAVTNYYRLVDFARRDARTFAAIHGQAILENPELNPGNQYGTTNASRAALFKDRQDEMNNRLAREREEFALVMFSDPRCGLCVTQWSVLQLFADQTGWRIAKIDVTAEPEKAARFGVSGTPQTVMLRRGGQQWANVAIGSQSLPNVAETAYRQVRILKGETDPSQFYTDGHQEGGFFDPRAGRAGGAR